MEHNVSLGCVVMAAGNARRFGANKLAAPLGGRSLILRCLEAVPAEQFERVVVVTQYPEIMRLAKEFHFAAIHNQHPEIGLSHTIQLGLTALESIALLAGRWRQQPDHAAALSHNGVRGNPCVFPAGLFSELMSLQGDRGGSTILRRHEDSLVLVDAPERELSDVDTEQALDLLRETIPD